MGFLEPVRSCVSPNPGKSHRRPSLTPRQKCDQVKPHCGQCIEAIYACTYDYGSHASRKAALPKGSACLNCRFVAALPAHRAPACLITSRMRTRRDKKVRGLLPSLLWSTLQIFTKHVWVFCYRSVTGRNQNALFVRNSRTTWSVSTNPGRSERRSQTFKEPHFRKTECRRLLRSRSLRRAGAPAVKPSKSPVRKPHNQSSPSMVLQILVGVSAMEPPALAFPPQDPARTRWSLPRVAR